VQGALRLKAPLPILPGVLLRILVGVQCVKRRTKGKCGKQREGRGEESFPAIRPIVSWWPDPTSTVLFSGSYAITFAPFGSSAPFLGVLVVTPDGCFFLKWNSGRSNSRYSGPIRREPAFESVRVRAVDTSHLLPTLPPCSLIRRTQRFRRCSRSIAKRV